ncbi:MULTISPECIES: amidohydrolase family protein [unclassified Nocardioides]|uniref:amidohydrolase family protein n=1 Tax=unclassified Nocardioides TaxID=2615069 RepID=UPI000A26F2A8|nr:MULTISPECIES: amidohydrolase family protein [unclassified Nocardioides]
MTVVDAHLHLWDLDAHPQPWTRPWPVLRRSFCVEELRAVLGAHGVGSAIVVQAGDTTGETLDLLVLAASETVIAGVVGWADVRAPDLLVQLDRLVASPGGHRLVGLRHQLQVEPDTRWLARTDVRAGLRRLADRALVFDLVVSPEQLPLVTETVRAVPETSFVLDHAGKPPIAGGDLSAWRRDITALAGLPNVAVKLSGLVTEAAWDTWTQEQLDPVIDHVVDCFGPGRVMAGSDWPVCLLAADYAAVQATLQGLLDRLDPDERRAVLGGTARRWYLGWAAFTAAGQEGR